MFERILFPTKFEEFSLSIFKSIACLKEAGLKEVILLHVIDTEGFYTEVDGGFSLNLDLVRQSARQKLDGLAESLRSEGIRVRSEIAMGPLVSEIITIAKEKNVSLIVAGRQKRDVLGELFVGSTTDRIIRKSKAPVLVAKPHALKEIKGKVVELFCGDLFRKILYATDWSPCAERARKYLPIFRKVGTTEVIIAHILEEAAARKEGEKKLAALRQELQTAGFNVKPFILEGKPYREINRLAAEEDVSLIVMGSHGMGLVEGVLWGSVSQRVVEYSEKPVLVVK